MEYFCWVAGGVAEFFIGTSAGLGLAVGVVGAVFFGLDPFGVVSPKKSKETGSAARQSSIDGAPVIGMLRRARIRQPIIEGPSTLDGPFTCVSDDVVVPSLG